MSQLPIQMLLKLVLSAHSTPVSYFKLAYFYIFRLGVLGPPGPSLATPTTQTNATSIVLTVTFSAKLSLD